MSNDNIIGIKKLLKSNNIDTDAFDIIEKFKYYAFHCGNKTMITLTLSVDDAIIELYGEKHQEIKVLSIGENITLERTEEFLDLIFISVNNEKIYINEIIC